jgi:hypothetical protein
MVLRILRRVARAWVPEGPASTRAGRGPFQERRSAGPAGDANKLGKRFYQLISEAGSFRSLGEVHTDVRRKAGFRLMEGASFMVYSVSSFATLRRVEGAALPVRAIHQSYP